MAAQTQHSTATIFEWYNTCRSVCSSVIERELQFFGTRQNSGQIDESYFSGRRKYSRGRLLQGDVRRRYIDDDESELPGWNEENSDCVNLPYGRDEKEWQWFLGIYFSRTQVRFIRVKNRTSEVLLSVIKKYLRVGSLIWTNEFKSYKCLSNHGYEHEMVNHSVNYVDPETGAHTQAVERCWVDGKSWYRDSNVNLTLLQSHQHETSRRKLRTPELNNGTLFQAFLVDIGNSYKIW